MLNEDAECVTNPAVVAAEKTIYTGFDGINDTFGQKKGRTTALFLLTATVRSVTWTSSSNEQHFSFYDTPY